MRSAQPLCIDVDPSLPASVQAVFGKALGQALVNRPGICRADVGRGRNREEIVVQVDGAGRPGLLILYFPSAPFLDSEQVGSTVRNVLEAMDPTLP
jgi:hypothetical protein